MSTRFLFTLVLVCLFASQGSAQIGDYADYILKSAKKQIDDLWPVLSEGNSKAMEKRQTPVMQFVISSGINSIKKADRLFESAIAEDCTYECPTFDVEPVPKPGHVPTYNGCGSYDVYIDNSKVHNDKV